MNNLKTRRNTMRAVKIYTEKTFADAPDGTYSWIYTNKGFYASIVRSTAEHGTRHIQLADRVKASELYMAGELQKTGKNVLFNFFSGTFMAKYMENSNNIVEPLVADAKKLFERMELESMYGSEYETMINAPLTHDELQSFKESGFTVYLYPDQMDCIGNRVDYEKLQRVNRFLFDNKEIMKAIKPIYSKYILLSAKNRETLLLDPHARRLINLYEECLEMVKKKAELEAQIAALPVTYTIL